jgi:hypothetical protein
MEGRKEERKEGRMGVEGWVTSLRKESMIFDQFKNEGAG